MLQRLIHPPERSYFLFGARGTGKSTWARSRYAGRPYFDLLDQEAFVSYQREPGRFGRQLAALDPGEWVVIDEIQRIPALLNEVHRAIEGRGQKFVLMGSSSRKLKRAGVNLLGGRASTRTLFPLLPSEIGPEFDLEDALRYGTLAIVWAAEDKVETLKAYAATYVVEEIRAEALARDLGSFTRFLSVAALFQGQVMNVSEVARSVGVSRTTVDSYFSILEDTLLTWRLPAFEARPRVRERAHSKLYWIDAGLVRSLKGSSGSVSPEERGHLLEGWVANTLRATSSYEGDSFQLSYLPTQPGLGEVDFILKRGEEHVAIEVKSAAKVDGKSLKGLRQVAGLPGIRKRILVCGVTARERTEDGIDIWPFAEFAASSQAAALFSSN